MNVYILSSGVNNESVIGIHITISWTCLPRPTHPSPLGCLRAQVWAPYIIQEIPTDSFAYGNVNVSVLPGRNQHNIVKQLKNIF